MSEFHHPEEIFSKPEIPSEQPLSTSSVPEEWTNERIIKNFPRHMTKAVFVGINYPGTGNALKGCIQDAILKFQYVAKYFGPLTRENTHFLIDDLQELDRIDPSIRQKYTVEIPTMDNIKKTLYWLTRDNKPGDVIYWHSSSHGSQMKDNNGDETDGQDECICPCDCDRVGFLRDDFIRERINDMPQGSVFVADFDSCHSASIADLPELASLTSSSNPPSIPVKVQQQIVYAPQQQQYKPQPYPQYPFVSKYGPQQYPPPSYPQPYAPLSYPQQYAPQQLAPQQYAPQQYVPQQYASQQYAPQQYAPYAPSSYPQQLAPQRRHRQRAFSPKSTKPEEMFKHFEWTNQGLIGPGTNCKDLKTVEHIIYYSRHDVNPDSLGNMAIRMARLRMNKIWIQAISDIPREQRPRWLQREKLPILYTPSKFSPRFGEEALRVMEVLIETDAPPPDHEQRNLMQRNAVTQRNMVVQRNMFQSRGLFPVTCPMNSFEQTRNLRTQSAPFVSIPQPIRVQTNRIIATNVSMNSNRSSEVNGEPSVNIKISSGYKETACVAIVFSGCLDTGTSADAKIAGKNMGAMTWAHLSALQDPSSTTILKVLSTERALLKRDQYEQIPQVSFGNHGSTLLNSIHPLHISQSNYHEK